VAVGVGPGEAPGFRIVPLDEVSLEEVLALLRSALGEGPLGRGEEAFRWKHRAGPFGPSPGLAAVAGDGTLVGVRLFQRWRLAAGGAELAAVRAVDTATHPEWRRRGVFRRLTVDLAEQVRDEGAALIFNTPNPHSRAGYLAMGWRSLGRVPLLVRPLRPGRLAATMLGGDRNGAAAAEPPRAPAETAPVAELLTQPEAERFLDGLWAGEPRLHTPRTAAYLRWRYGEPPADALPYGARWRFEGATGAVVIARERVRRGLTGIVLSEVLVRGGERGERAATELVGKIAARSGADYLAAIAARGTPERRALRAAGLLPVGRRGPHLIVRELAPPPTPVAPASWRGWRLAAGDLELF
jgi:GNAT superfamily N-acetyltransferase